jgi:XapX domain-containing protein
MKILLGFLLAFGIGAVCRFAGIPSPAPNAILGSLLVVSMSLGYVTAGRYLQRSKNTTSHLVTPSSAVAAKTENSVQTHPHQNAHHAITPRNIG